EPNLVESLWRDPLLRFSRALDGLFHEGVVVCEGDSDSQFYSAVTYHLAEQADAASADEETTAEDHGADAPADVEEGAESLQLTPNPFDVMFTYAGGKQRVKLLAGALVGVHVPVRCVVDFDVLNDQGILRGIVEAMGESYDPELEALRKQVDAGIRGNV